MEQKRKIVPPVYLLLSLLLMTALHWLWPVARIIDPPYSYPGAAIIAFGIVLVGHSAASFNRAGTPLIPFERSTALVTSGAFRYTRNPMYIGLLLILIGAAVLFGTVGPWLPIPIFAGIIQANFIRGEERFLEEIFGEQYLAYKKRVRRWL